MGLAEPKRKFKLSNDPNNTRWTKDTTSFGHKIMSQQGWTPGQYLGAQNAPHAEFHTEANASHIRVVLKDDNLGIGAKKGSGVAQGDCVGLDVFQTLLGRLNADDEDEFVAEQKRREDLRTAIYSERKWGTIRFVSGGFLIGDKIQDLIDGEKERLKDLKAAKDAETSSDDNSDSDSDSDSDEEEKVVKKSKKVSKVTEIEIETEKLSINKSRSKKRKAEDDDDNAADRTAKKEDKEQKKAEKKAAKKLEKTARKQSEKEDESTMTKEERKQKKKEKKERKEKKRAEKAVKKAAKALTKEKKKCSAVPTPPASGTSTPRPILQSGRLAVRARWIEQKRLAAMGGSATNEIFMIKGK